MNVPDRVLTLISLIVAFVMGLISVSAGFVLIIISRAALLLERLDMKYSDPVIFFAVVLIVGGGILIAIMAYFFPQVYQVQQNQ